MVSRFEEVGKIIAFTPKVKIQDDRLLNNKIYPIEPSSFWKFSPAIWRRYALGRSAQIYGAAIYHGLSAELPSDIDFFEGKKIVTVHDVLFKTRPSDYSAIDRRIYDYKLRKALAAADVIHCISKQTKSELIDHYHVNPTKCIVIYQSVHPNFYNTHKFKDLISPPYKKFILCVGTIEPRKNTLSLLKAIENLKIPLVLIGRIKNSYRNEILPVYMRLLNLNLLHHINPSDIGELSAWYSHASLVVYPSVAEGFGLPPLEAAAAGKVCITGPAPCLIEASGLPECQTSGSTEDLIRTIEALWNNQSLLQKLSLKAHLHSLKLSPEKIGTEWLKIYTSMLNH